MFIRILRFFKRFVYLEIVFQFMMILAMQSICAPNALISFYELLNKYHTYMICYNFLNDGGYLKFLIDSIEIFHYFCINCIDSFGLDFLDIVYLYI